MGRPPGWREAIHWAVYDLSGSYRVAFDERLALDSREPELPSEPNRLGHPGNPTGNCWILSP